MRQAGQTLMEEYHMKDYSEEELEQRRISVVSLWRIDCKQRVDIRFSAKLTTLSSTIEKG